MSTSFATPNEEAMPEDKMVDRFADEGVEDAVPSSPGLRDALFCGVVTVLTALAAWPFAEVGFIDDWSYKKSASMLASTGHLVYNGWSTAMLGWQLYLGALFIRLFGDSYTSVRMSTLLVSFLTVVLFERTLAGFGLNRRNAIFGALTLGLSPVFLPLSVSFMSDTNAVFVLVLCCYCCRRALTAESDRAVWWWLVLAGVTNAVGGTVRQTVWFSGLTLIPATAWLLRRRRGVVPLAGVLVVLIAATMFGCVLWWNHLPFAVQDEVLELSEWSESEPVRSVVRFAFIGCGTVLCLAGMAFPILASWLLRPRRLPVLGVMGLVIFAGFACVFPPVNFPFLTHVMTELGPATGATHRMEGGTDVVLAVLLALLSAAVLGAAIAFWSFLRRGPRGVADEPSSALSWGAVKLFSLPYLAIYGLLMLTRVIECMIFDRYLLGMFPLVILCLLRLYQDRIGGRLPGFCYAVLVGMALFAVAGTHDWLQKLLALRQAEDALVASGIPRTRISSSPQSEGMTQLDVQGFVNEPRMHFPIGAYREDLLVKDVPAECQTWLSARASAIHPQYIVREGRRPCVAGVPFTISTYPTWLPPFHRSFYTLRLPAAARQR